MANADRPSGFTPVEHLNGNPYNGKYRMYYVPVTDGTALFKGDLVTLAGSADATGIYPTVVQGAINDQFIGVIVGFSNTPQMTVDTSDLSRAYRLASTALYVAVCDDPDVIYEVQEDSVDGNLAATDVGQVFDPIVGSGNTSSGASGMELDSGTTGAGDCTIAGFIAALLRGHDPAATLSAAAASTSSTVSTSFAASARLGT